jgi:sugar phosphate isomerase/epimerase
MQPELTRRDLIAGLAAAAGAGSLRADAKDAGRFTICAFSKHFQWTDVKEMSDICAGIGYEGIDLTVRGGGHVEPARVADDLPKSVEIIRQAGLKPTMITTDIVDARSPYAEQVLKAMKSLGIRRYRWGGLRYQDNVGIPEQLAEFQPRVKDLAALNRQYGVCAMYHTHSGVGQVGASMWDLYLLLKDYDTEAVSANYDVGHATVEGGLGGWIHSARLLTPYMKGVAVKDFQWERNRRGAWVPGWCALGQGMVDFKRFFAMLKAARFSGPLQLHMEYDELGGADAGKKTFTIPKPQLLAIYKRDIDTLKRMLAEGGLL